MTPVFFNIETGEEMRKDEFRNVNAASLEWSKEQAEHACHLKRSEGSYCVILSGELSSICFAILICFGIPVSFVSTPFVIPTTGRDMPLKALGFPKEMTNAEKEL